MSDDNQPTTPSQPSTINESPLGRHYANRADSVASLVAGLQQDAPATPRATATDSGHAMSYNSATGEITTHGTAPQRPGSGRLTDTGVDINHRLGELQQRVDDSAARLMEFSFDQRTGEKVLRLQGLERDRAVEQHARLFQSMEFEAKYLAALKEQRAEDAAAAATTVENTAAVAKFVAGDPMKAAMLREELARRQASDLADRLLAKRKG